jgi:hypothetical protein
VALATDRGEEVGEVLLGHAGDLCGNGAIEAVQRGAQFLEPWTG